MKKLIIILILIGISLNAQGFQEISKKEFEQQQISIKAAELKAQKEKMK